jgi:folate-binding protein YgfZ
VSVAEEVGAVRRTAGVFALRDRALLEVRGSDRLRFLQGQLTNDLAALDPAGPHAGCHALALTREGRIVAELHVVVRPEAVWLETDGASRGALVARLERYVVADDVRITDRSDTCARFGVEGPAARAVLAAAVEAAVPLGAGEVATFDLAGAPVVVAAWGWSGEHACQLFGPAAAGPAVALALARAAAAHGAIVADAEALEVLRIEAGVPRQGAELGEDTLPAEADLVARTVSFTKGCYTGQEVVARMESRGRVGHRLVGLRLGAPALPAPGAAIGAGGARVGAVTSAALSPAAGAIALGFVRSGSEAPGTRVEVDGQPARVVALPFVAPGAAPR